ncbi:hypothetical protein C8F01DRAFT_1371595 [Mycena amicta]|nr:hypothetical protein C8F01DRAFT_1371595 [Mycena amicta]
MLALSSKFLVLAALASLAVSSAVPPQFAPVDDRLSADYMHFKGLPILPRDVPNTQLLNKNVPHVNQPVNVGPKRDMTEPKGILADVPTTPEPRDVSNVLEKQLPTNEMVQIQQKRATPALPKLPVDLPKRDAPVSLPAKLPASLPKREAPVALPKLPAGLPPRNLDVTSEVVGLNKENKERTSTSDTAHTPTNVDPELSDNIGAKRQLDDNAAQSQDKVFYGPNGEPLYHEHKQTMQQRAHRSKNHHDQQTQTHTHNHVHYHM